MYQILATVYYYIHACYVLKPSSNRSPYIFTLVQKVKHRVYKLHAFLNEAILSQHSASYFIQTWYVLLARTKLEKRYPHFKKSHFSTI